MEAKELRIGNLVINEFENYKGKHSDLTEALASDMMNCEDLKPIPLTEEWLIKFGFEQNHWESENRDQKTMCFNGQSIEVWNDGRFYMSEIDLFITSVHQLQNLYFALTGSEL